MQASIESTGNLERRLTFSLPEERLQSHINGRLGEIARTVRIKGFRPGKVPAKVVEQRFGQQVRAEAMDGLLRETFDAALRQHELRIAGNPRIDKAGEGEFDFVATVELVPDFGDVDVTKLTVVRHSAEVTDADIDQMIENLRFVSESSFGPQGFQVCIGSDPSWRLPVRRKKVEAEPALALFMPHVFPHHRSREGVWMVSDFRMERPGWSAPGNRPSFPLTREQGQRTRSLQNNGLPDHLLIPWQVQKGGISGYHR